MSLRVQILMGVRERSRKGRGRERGGERDNEKSLRLAEKIYESGIKGDASSE